MVDLSDPGQKLVAETAVKIFMEIFKEGIKGAEKLAVFLGKKAKEKAKEYDLFGNLYYAYRTKLEEDCDVIQILGMREPRKLRGIYIHVNILEKILRDEWHTPEELQELIGADDRSFGTRLNARPGDDVFNEKKKLIVLGKPGAGKTTFLKYLTLKALDGKLQENLIPIYVSLKEWDEYCEELKEEDKSKDSLLQFIVKRFYQYGAPDAQSFIERLLYDGRCLLLLDGFDEVKDIDKSIGEVQNFTRTFDKNQYVLSCRVASWDAIFEHFTTVEMADFNDEQIQQFVERWFGEKDAKTAGKCWDELKSDPPVMELARSPLLLAMLCIAYNQNLNFPTKRSNLYKDAVNTMIRDWDTKRRIKRKEIIDGLTPDRKERLLSILAAKTFEQDKYFFQQEIAVEQIEAYLEKLLDLKSNQIKVDCRDILKSLEDQHGLVVERSKEIYSFSHLSIQEFLTAKYIQENRGKGSLRGLINMYMLKEKWREVFLLLTGLLNDSDADDFFIEFRKRISQLADKELLTFLEKIDKTIRPQPGFPTGINRLYSILAISGDRDFSNRFAQCNKKALDFDGAFIEFPSGKIAMPPSMEDYAKASKLFLECLTSECDVSRSVKKQLLDGIFLESWEYQEDWKEKNIAVSTPKEDCSTIVTVPLKIPDGAVPFEFVRIQPGSVMMGEDKKVREVSIEKEFCLGRYPVTQAQWKAVMGNNPSNFKGYPNRPVECVSWNDCREFIEKINKMDIGIFRLPSEMEWEYACRAGTTTTYYWGDDSDEKEIWNYEWFIRNSFSHTHDVGTRKMNPWGLYDMSGNVLEWCYDIYSGSNRVLRGGSWFLNPRNCRSARRGWVNPDARIYNIGFRVVYSRT